MFTVSREEEVVRFWYADGYVGEASIADVERLVNELVFKCGVNILHNGTTGEPLANLFKDDYAMNP